MSSPRPIPSLRAIVAMDSGGTIGSKGHLPWHLPADMRLFRSLTLGQTVIMGRKTFESIGKPLAGRRCWVLSHHISPPPLRTFSSTHSLLESIGEAAYGEEFWLIGGAEIYRQLVPYCCEIVQTLLEESYGGDVFWRIPEDFTAVSSLLTNEQFTTYRLRRKSVAPLAFSAQC